MKKGIASLKQKAGFTIVELLVVIVIIGLLVGVVIVAYHGWRQTTADNVMQSDLNGAASAMENAKTWGSGYPATIPSTFQASDGVTLAGGARSGGTAYCISASSTQDPDTTYYLSNTMTKPAEGTCPVAVGPTVVWSGLTQRTGSLAGTSTPQITMPTSTLQPGDIIVVFMATEDNPQGFTTPIGDTSGAGWNTSIYGYQDLYWFQSVFVSTPLTSSDVSSYNGATFNGAGGTDSWSMAAVVVRGAGSDTPDPAMNAGGANSQSSAPSTITVGSMTPSSANHLALIWADEQNFNEPSGNLSVSGWTSQQATNGDVGDTWHAVGLFTNTVSAATGAINMTAAPWSGWASGNSGGYGWISLGFGS